MKMNEQLQAYARQEIKNGLAQVPKASQDLFKRMYSHTNLNASLSDIVDLMPEEKLARAMQQIKRTLNT